MQRVIVVGGGIVGAACAWELARRGHAVTVFDAGLPSATKQGMGHLVALDGDPLELEICAYSLQLWREWLGWLPACCDYRPCGTLWLAELEADREAAQVKQQNLAGQDIESQWLTPAELQAAEPALRAGLAGALRVPGDGIIYAPQAARCLLQDHARITVRQARVASLQAHAVTLQGGEQHTADAVVLACGLGAGELLPGLPMVARKGHLAITDRYPGHVSHQLVDLAYTRQAHLPSSESIAFNIQPRPTGQLLIGSTRQNGDDSREIRPELLARMLDRAQSLLPQLAGMNVIRCWTGLRPATRDELPLIGRWPPLAGLWLALGHEGHGVTTAPGSAVMLADLMQGLRPAIDAGAYDPARVLPEAA